MPIAAGMPSFVGPPGLGDAEAGRQALSRQAGAAGPGKTLRNRVTEKCRWIGRGYSDMRELRGRPIEARVGCEPHGRTRTRPLPDLARCAASPRAV